ncbi:MAG TPA: CRTAC1 family protein [Candidatus Fermentibacter daniensis]|jgi:hypothetical protein|nr:MAG: hypothetical protein AO396_06850 [Candidatus Fermentibacter daniensis]KZD15604.1 MAG: hypothetical protein AO395_05775 [Candidatus Fermentibacter daniensis]HOA05668.1 CRTAC1 family protein [Candidatus Fermentibacter daniensis]HOD19334.1 CRTAC1 family protein [Candidatus Fermentibacter daniensis]HOG54807.1 CRTAC1 family protein [Candidatus Fermentibacter daniensis]
MTTALFIAVLAAGFDEELALRRFDAALDLASNDSLAAEVYLAAGEYAMAAHLFTLVHEASGSAGSLLRLWTAVLGDWSDASRAMPIESAAYRLEGLHPPATAAEAAALASLASLLDAPGLFERTTALACRRWPGSPEAADMLCGIFWDAQAPVWEDDSARAAVLSDFIDEWGWADATWRSRARQYRVSALLGTADSLNWRDEIALWAADCPDDPLPFLTGAALSIDRDSSWEEALAFADRGFNALESGNWTMAGLRKQERALTMPAVGVDLAFRRAWALMELDRPAEASEVIRPYLEDPDFFGPDDHHTLAATWWLEGRLRKLRNSFDAPEAFLRSAELGDTADRWAGLSIHELEEAWGPSWPDSARAKAGYAGPVFEDVTWMLSDTLPLPAGRIAWADIDNDGWEDLLAGGRLFRNDAGLAFTDITSASGLDLLPGSEWVAGDLDRDGDADLACSGSAPRVFINDSGGFRDAGCDMGILPVPSSVEGVGLLDWNADGFLDVYFACYEEPGTLGKGTPDRFYLGGPESFIEATEAAGMIPFRDVALCGRGVSPCDFDRDGDVDVFVSNYRLQENFLWENRDGTAASSALEAGVAGHDKDGWWGHTIGSAWADFDNDGDWDLFSANLAHPRFIDISDRSELLVDENGSFRDERAARGIGYEETHSVPAWGDWNNDGLLDLYITSVYEGRRSFMYLQQPDGTFLDVTLLSGTRVHNGWGAASADFDRDGRLDLAVGSGSGMRLFRNVTEGGRWLLVEVDPPEAVNASGIGCTVEIVQEGVARLRQVSGGSGTTCQDGAVLHFGLPSDAGVDWSLFVPGSAEPVAGGRLDGVDRIVNLP